MKALRVLPLIFLLTLCVCLLAACGSESAAAPESTGAVQELVYAPSFVEIARDAPRSVAADATAFMRELADAGEHADIVLMDPPRAGSTPEFLDVLAALAPERVVYISCNPETQARDVRILARHGYVLRIVQPVDMFPHTDHVETVALIAK